jgi:hypothetical protein
MSDTIISVRALRRSVCFVAPVIPDRLFLNRAYYDSPESVFEQVDWNGQSKEIFGNILRE